MSKNLFFVFIIHHARSLYHMWNSGPIRKFLLVVFINLCRAVRRFHLCCLILLILMLLVLAFLLTVPNDKVTINKKIQLYQAHENSVHSTIGYKWTQLNMSMMSERMASRRKYLKDTCQKLGLDILGNDVLHKPNAWEFLINRQYHLVWCNVFKAASTSWMYNFNLLAGYNPNYLSRTKIHPVNLARKKYPRPSLEKLVEALNDSLSFLIVRHPFERLLSTYREKLEFASRHTYHRKLGDAIIHEYRPGCRQVIKEPYTPTFGEFVRYLIDTHEAKIKFDMHWTPITEFCTPCLIHFDVILKFETLQEDQMYLIKKAQLEKIIKPVWKNKLSIKKDKAKNKFELMSIQALRSKYFSQLTRKQIQKLYDIFRYDFQLFNYTMDEYKEKTK